VVPSLHVSLSDVSHGGGPPSVGPPLLPPMPLPVHTTVAGESRTGVASTGSPPEVLDETAPELLPEKPELLPEMLPELLPDVPPELLLEPGPPSLPPPPVLPPHAKASAGTQTKSSAKLR
jgi:hypothetical protein